MDKEVMKRLTELEREMLSLRQKLTEINQQSNQITAEILEKKGAIIEFKKLLHNIKGKS